MIIFETIGMRNATEHALSSTWLLPTAVSLIATPVKLGLSMMASIVGQTTCLYVPVASDSSIFHYYVYGPPTSTVQTNQSKKVASATNLATQILVD